MKIIPSKRKIMLDCGSFASLKTNKPIDIKEYIEFTLEYESVFEQMVQLDVIYDQKETEKNYDKMKEAGCKVMPVFSVSKHNVDIKGLKDFLNRHKKELICLGGISKIKPSKREEFLKTLYYFAPDANVHLLGIASDPSMKYPIYSTDSSSGRKWVLQGLKMFTKEGAKNVPSELGDILNKTKGRINTTQLMEISSLALDIRFEKQLCGGYEYLMEGKKIRLPVNVLTFYHSHIDYRTCPSFNILIDFHTARKKDFMKELIAIQKGIKYAIGWK